MKYLTVNSGHVMEWGRERLDAGTAALLRPTLRQGTADIPRMPGYRRHICVAMDGPPPGGHATGGLTLVIERDQLVPAIYGLGVREPGASQVWRGLSEQRPSGVIMPGMPVSLPWLAALLLEPAVRCPPDDLALLADYAACLATCLLAEIGERSLSA